jgi:hypothetical protein
MFGNCRLLFAGFALLSPLASLAHHAFALDFDKNLQGQVSGVVTKVSFRNPHVRYFVEVAGDNGESKTWELQPPGNVSIFRRENWHANTIQEGDRLEASGNLGRNGTAKLYATCIQIVGGRRLGLCESDVSIQVTTADPSQTYTYSANDYKFDISGFWDNRYKFEYTVDDLRPKPIPHTEESRRIYAAQTKEQDNALRCRNPGLPRIFGSHAGWEIVDAGEHYLIVSEQNSIVRRIWMDGRAIPDEVIDTPMGFSLGRWDGRTLIIESTNLSEAWLDGSGYPMSGGDGTRIVEHWTVADDNLTIDRKMTIYDELYTEPLTRVRGSQRGPEPRQLESAECVADEHLRELFESGKMGSIFGPPE